MAKHPAMKILDTQEGRGGRDGSERAMQDLLTRFPALDAVFTINDPSALGCISAIEAAGRAGQVTIVSVDGSSHGAEAILAGKLDASVAQYPREIGRLAADRAYAYLAGQPVEKDVKVPVRLITRENAAALLKAK
jgi:ribose transport system substrate-binding protein